jgi:hypothetical protein
MRAKVERLSASVERDRADIEPTQRRACDATLLSRT